MPEEVAAKPRPTALAPEGSLEELVASCLEAELRGDPGAVEALLAQRPQQAAAAREQLADLARTGLLDPLPEAIGPYRVRGLLGRGGMGEVYLAEQQEPVQREVAVKLVKRGMDTREILARFAAERQALARMNHPAIAQVFDAGSTADGRPYFAMEYVAGQPIQIYCDRHRLEMPARLELFLAVCEGVQHAHLKGILHRDLKPSNLLVAEVDGRAMVKVIDFGIAKAIDEDAARQTLHTARGVLLGTPEYMSPEQAAGDGADLDLRSDVYSLGVVLYELLTGELPFAARRLRGELPRLREFLLSEEPPPPSRRVTGSDADTTQRLAQRRTTRSELVRHLRGDLDGITLKALARERAERYASVGELAADLRRHLAHEPVLAAVPSRLYRLRKFVRRHRLQVLTAALVLGALIAGLVASSIYRRRAEDSAARAELALEAEQRARGDAELQFSRAFAAVDALLRRVADESLDGVPQAESVRRTILRDAARFCDELLAGRAEDPRTLELRAATRVSLAELARQTLEPAVAERECRAALEILEGERASALPPLSRRIDLARAHFVLARLHADARRTREEELSYAAADAALQELLAEDREHEDGLRLLTELRVGRAGALLQRDSPATSAAIDAARTALDEWRARRAPSAELTTQEVELASVAADEALARRDLEAARMAIARGESAWQDASTEQHQGPELRTARLDLLRSRGNALLAEQRYEEALPLAHELVAIAEELAARHPSVAHFRRSVGYGHGCLGVAYQHLGRLAEAQPAYRRAVGILGAPENRDAAQPALQSRAGVYGICFAGIVLARRDAAALEDALAVVEGSLAALEPERELASLREFYRHALRSRASLLEHLGRPREALDPIAQEIEILLGELVLDDAPPEVLGDVGERLGRAAVTAHFARAPERAELWLTAAEPIVRRLEERAPEEARTHMVRGGLALPAGLLAAARGDADAAWRAAKTFAERAGTLGDDTRALALQLLLRTARIASGKLREACLRAVLKWCRDELSRMETDPQRFALVKDLPQVRRDFELALGVALALDGDEEGALEAFSSAVEGELSLVRAGFAQLLAQDRLALALELRAELAAQRGEIALRDASLAALAELALPAHALRAAELALASSAPALALDLLEARARRLPPLRRAEIEGAELSALGSDERFRALKDSLR